MQQRKLSGAKMSAMIDLQYEVAVTYFYLPDQMILVVHNYDPMADKVRAGVTSPRWVATKLIALVNSFFFGKI
jgi:hypothetical protein